MEKNKHYGFGQQQVVIPPSHQIAARIIPERHVVDATIAVEQEVTRNCPPCLCGTPDEAKCMSTALD